MPEFVFMLTRDDTTIPDARRVYEEVAGTGVTHVGCKDVGLPRAELAALVADIHAANHTSYLEVVSESREATLESARVASEIGVDYLIGGTLVEPVQEAIAGTEIRFFPYAGRIVGHPCLLRGGIDEIARDAARAEALGVDGVNLLAYRYDGDVPALVGAVSNATSLPLLCAGSVDRLDRVRELAGLGVWGFTVGTAALDGRFVPGAPLAEQLGAILGVAREATASR
jgi:uncharacterized protein YdbL (DUF1318 family)